jgi:hypothetical protein
MKNERKAQSLKQKKKGRSKISNNKTGGLLGRNTLEKKEKVPRSKIDDIESLTKRENGRQRERRP